MPGIATSPTLARLPGYQRPPEFAASNAFYDAATTGGRNRRHWVPAQQLSASAAHSEQMRRLLRDRSRYEVANNTYAAGMLDTLAGDVIGTGPRLQLMLEDSGRADAIEALWQRWADEIGLPELLFTAHFAESESGEVFLRPYVDMDIDSVPLNIELIEADRVTGGWIRSRDGEHDGITYDAKGKPASYRVLHGHPGDELPDFSSTVYGAAQIIHLMRRTRPGQQRGIPRLTPALNALAELRRYMAAVLAAAEGSAAHYMAIVTDLPADEDPSEVEPMEEIEFEHNMALTLPAGAKLQGFSPTQPTTNHVEFVRAQVVVAARCLNMPANIALGDSSGYNYASGRLDWQTYEHANRRDRKRVETNALDRILEAFLIQALIDPDSPVTADLSREGRRLPHGYFWSGRGHVDPLKEANGAATRLEHNMTTLADVVGQQGQDWEAILRQRKRELDRMVELGLPLPASAAAGKEEGQTDDDE